MKRPVYPKVSDVFTDPRMLLAFGLGSGLSRVVPGTLGTLAAVPFFLLLSYLPLWLYMAVIALAWWVGNHICDYASNKMGVHDHGGIVWDEFVGFWIAMIALPLTWHWVLAGFIVFRFFDMVKPWPIGWLDKHVHGGKGIMLDDVVAGIMTLICLHGYHYFFYINA